MTESENKLLPTDEQVERFVKLLTINQHRIYTFIHSMMPDSNDADDVMQETTAIMWRKFGDYQTGTDFVAWGSAIAYYSVKNYRRKKKGAIQLSEEAIEALCFQAPIIMDRFDSRLEQLKECVKKLASNDQRLIYMRYNQEMGIKIIADRLDMQWRRVYRNLARIHTMLLRCVSREDAI